MQQLRLLSSPHDQVWGHHDIVVIGSGYGGAIAANRLARAGQKVTVLERGRELHPGEYPHTEAGALRHLQVTPLGPLRVDKRNLFWLHVGRDMNVLTGCGLGGTSLINANVSMAPERAVLEDARWPEALRNDGAGLQAGYERARAILRPTPYPATYPALHKDAALRRAAGSDTYLATDINVQFHTGPNAVGVEQQACTGCGDCVTGCNVGAKNTLLMNYLPDAVAHGARIFTEIDVDRVEPGRRGEWVVWATSLTEDPVEVAPRRIVAKTVIIAAGVLGSTAILLRSQQTKRVAFSERLGQRFSANGDMLGFATGATVPVDGFGAGDGAIDEGRLPGPCITAAIDTRPGRDLPEAIVIENAVIPGALTDLVPAVLAAEALARWLRRLRRGRPTGAGFLGDVLRRGKRGALARVQTYLLIGHDNGDGAVELDPTGNAVVNWPGVGESAHFERGNRRMRDASRGVGGSYQPNPIWSKTLGHPLITVHPLGGCAMGEDHTTGVVDHAGRVFDPDPGSATGRHEGLYVWDGSIVPLPLGVNPLLTIAALAERAVALMAAEKAAHAPPAKRQTWEIDYRLPDTPPPQGKATLPRPVPGLRFAETLGGFWSDATGASSVPAEFVESARLGQTEDRPLTVNLTISTDDLRRVTADPGTPLRVEGVATIPTLSPDPIEIDGGQFRLLAPAPGGPGTYHMIYVLPLRTAAGAGYHLAGFKLLEPGALDDVWPASTTLYVTLRRHDQRGRMVGQGVVTIGPEGFVKVLHSMTVTGSVGGRERLELLARFGERFGGALFRDYGHVVHPSDKRNPDAPPRPRRPLDVPPAEVFHPVTDDGVTLRLTRYNGGAGQPDERPVATVVVSHGMGANPLTFSIDTIKPNLLEYLTARGYDVWLQEWRGSTLLASATEASFDGDQVARFDHPATERFVLEQSGAESLHWITHCVGSMTVMMSMLGGWLRPASLLVSSAGAHPVPRRIVGVETRFHLAELLRAVGITHLSTDSTIDESFAERVFDKLVRLNWIPPEERCDQATCHRLEFLYGVATHHPAVDPVTHMALHELFGVTNLQMMSHLSECARQGKLVSAGGGDVYMPNLERLLLPITFIHGSRNLVWVPESSERTFDELVELADERQGPGKGDELYRRHVLETHGHQDLIMGADAWQSSFPRVLEHLARVGAGPGRRAPSAGGRVSATGPKAPTPPRPPGGRRRRTRAT